MLNKFKYLSIALAIGFSMTAAAAYACEMNVFVNVQNAGGGTQTASTFTVNVTGNNPSPASFQGSASGTRVTFSSEGNFAVTQASSSNYTTSYSSSCSGKITEASDPQCVITDTYVVPAPSAPATGTLIIVTNVSNLSIGTSSATDFTDVLTEANAATSTLTGSASGTLVTLTAGSYSVAQASSSNYSVSYSADCSGTIAAGDAMTCTVTDTYIVPPTQVAPTSTPSSCWLSASDFANDLQNGSISYAPIAITSSTATITVANHTNCDANLLFGSNEMFVPIGGPNWLSSQVPFDRATSTLAASSTITMTVNLPSCMAQIDAWQDVNPANPFSYAFTSAPLCSSVTSTPSADLSVMKTVDNATPSEGSMVNYTVMISALGPATSTGVLATDLLPSGLTFENATATVGTYASSTGTWTIGDMSASSTADLEIAALVNSGTAGTTIVNTASAGESASSTDNNPANNSSSVSITVQSNGCTTNCGGGSGGGTGTGSGDADISITKTVDNANPVGGATVNYTITVTALGPATSSIVASQDQLPMGLSLVSATTSVGMYDMSTGNWTIGTLSPNATATLLIAATVSPSEDGQSITNTATVTQLSSLVDPNPSNNSSSVTINVQPAACTSNCGGGGGGGGGGISTAEIGITKMVDNANPNPGDTINYTLTIQALGPTASIGVVASDTLPAGVTFVSASSSAGTYNSNTGTWTLGSVNVGANPTLVITATVNSSDTIGETITNTATVSESTNVNDPLTGNNTASATITVGGSSNGGGGGGGGNGGGGSNTGVASGGGGTIGGGSTGNGGGEVLGATATCGIYLDQYIHPIRQDLNDPNEVKKLQVFLNMNLGTTLPITGTYGPETIAAVNEFQVKYHIEVLRPWLNYGLPTEFTPTSYVYKTTQRWINLIMCSSLNLPIPQLP